MKTALLPGSYDPFTCGHLDVVRRTASLFDSVTVLVAHNTAKKYMLTAEQRLTLVRDAVSAFPNVSAEAFDGMLIDYAASHGNPVLVKGIRNQKDFDYECEMAAYNRHLSLRKYGTPTETLFLPCCAEYSEVSSSLVRTLLSCGAPYDDLLPNPKLFRRLFNS